MPGDVIDGRRIAADMCGELAPRVAAATAAGVRPGFAVIVADDDPAARGHARRKMLACERIGMYAEAVFMAPTVTEADVLRAVRRLNDDDRVHGILAQLPLPPHMCATCVLHAIHPRKDADGYHPENVGRTAAGDPRGVPRAAALAVQQLLLRHGVAIRGAHAVVLGHTDAVARPVATLLGRDRVGGGAAVTLCPAWSRDLGAITRTADILVAALGRAGFVTRDLVKPGAVVIDAGANLVPDATRSRGYRLAGDVNFDDVRAAAAAVSPVPGGVGPATVAALLSNTVQAAESCLGN